MIKILVLLRQKFIICAVSMLFDMCVYAFVKVNERSVMSDRKSDNKKQEFYAQLGWNGSVHTNVWCGACMCAHTERRSIVREREVKVHLKVFAFLGRKKGLKKTKVEINKNHYTYLYTLDVCEAVSNRKKATTTTTKTMREN